MLEVVLASLALAFGLSVALNLLQSSIIGDLRREISQKDDDLDDLRTAISGIGAEASAWSAGE